jgi:hypothetical protein
VVATGLEDVIRQVQQIASLKSWRPMSPDEVDYYMKNEKNKG